MGVYVDMIALLLKIEISSDLNILLVHKLIQNMLASNMKLPRVE